MFAAESALITKSTERRALLSLAKPIHTINLGDAIQTFLWVNVLDRRSFLQSRTASIICSFYS